MASSQHKATPPAGSTRLFQIASRCRPVRQRTRPSQANVPALAASSAANENCGSKPGAKRAMFAAGLMGEPVCMPT